MRYEKDYCTCSPDELFGIYFGDICRRHDIDYTAGGSLYDKLKADFKLGYRIAKKSPKLWLVGLIYAIFTIFFGRRHFTWRKTK